MASNDKRVLDMTSATALAGTEAFYADQSGDVQVSATQIKTFTSAAPTLTGSVVAPGSIAIGGGSAITSSGGGGALVATAFSTDAANLSGTLNNARLSAVPNSALANSAVTISSHSLSLGGSLNLAQADISGLTTASSPTFTGTTLGVQQTTQGSLVLANTAAGAFSTTIRSSNSASAAWTLTLPTTAGTNTYLLQTDGSGVTSWVAASAIGTTIGIGSTVVSGGTSGRLLYDNAGVVGEYTITGTAGSVVMSASPTLTGTLTAAAITASGAVRANGTLSLNAANNGGQLYVLSASADHIHIERTASTAGSYGMWISVDGKMNLADWSAAKGLTITPTTGVVTFNANVASTSTTTGSVVITGGLGVSGNFNFGGVLGVTGFTSGDASGNTTFIINSAASGKGDIFFESNGSLLWDIEVSNTGDTFKLYSQTFGNYVLTATSTGSVIVGSAALATNATNGFLYIPTCAGTPTGTPTTQSGRIPMIYDTTNHQFWFYDGGWKQPKTPAGAALVTWQ